MGTAHPFQDLPLTWTDRNFQSLLEALRDAVLIVNQEGKIVVANNQAMVIFGYSREELMGRPIEWLVPPRLRDLHALNLKQYFSDPHPGPMGVGLEFLAQRSDGTDFPVEINLNPVVTEAGPFVISVIRDATAANHFRELKGPETALHEMYEAKPRFRLTGEFSPMMIWMSGTDGLYTYFNDPWLDFTGRSLAQERGNGWTQGIHRDDLQRRLNIFTHALERQEEFKTEYRLQRHDGEYRWIFDEGIPRFNTNHSFAGYIGSCMEMTGVKRMEESLLQREIDLIESQRLIGIGTWRWRAGSGKLTWSEELYRIAGRDPALPPPTYKELSRLLTAESWERLRRAVEGTLLAGTPDELDLEMIQPDGATRWARVRGEAQRDNTGDIVQLRGTAQDITDRKQTERELSGVSARLLEAQEQERSRIARDLHDDISQRLALLVNDMEGLENDLQDSTAEARSRIHEIGQRASEICSDIQDISHQLHSSKLQYLGIETAAKLFCKEISNHEKLEIDFRSANIPPVVPEDTSLCLFRVLQEALHNAAKHSGASRVEVDLRGASGEIQLTVRDRGVGFDPAGIMKRNGLGLISIRERVGLVGGTFSIISKPHSGTEIRVRVPVSVDEQASRAAG